MEYSGTLKITNAKTLTAWKENGKYNGLISQGYIYAKGCGRFRKLKCECSKCRKINNN